MSNIKSSLHNILDHSASGLSEITYTAHEILNATGCHEFEINLLNANTNPRIPDQLDRLHKSVEELIQKSNKILISTSGHELQFFDSIILIISMTPSKFPQPNISDCYTAFYKVRLIANYNNIEYNEVIEKEG